MIKCDKCEKEFATYRGLNGHKRLHGESNGKYTVERKNAKHVHKFSCLQCGLVKDYKPTASGGKYCSHICQQQYIWENVTKVKIEAGECTHNASAILKKYLAEKHGENCACCGLGNVWNGLPITLQLDHIDGDSDNNFPSNLRLICPNCHTQTATFGSKGRGSRYSKITKRNEYLRDYKGRMV